MALFRRRLIFWLIRAYFKRWGKVIFISFIVGLLFFFLLASTSRMLLDLIPFQKKSTIGMVGAYTVDRLPEAIIGKVSRGLTKVGSDGSIVPDVAADWEIKDQGRTYEFTLKRGVHFSDGEEVTSELVNYEFADVTVEKPDKYRIIFKLKDPYSPFLVTTSRPIYRRGSVGIGEYTINDIELNGDYVKSLRIVSAKDKLKSEQYQFYPTEESLKLAFLLGEVNYAVDLTDVAFKDTTFTSFPNIKINREVNYGKLVTIFYNTIDPVLSDKKVRSGLTYALPNNFAQGERSYVSYPPTSQYASPDLIRVQDTAHAKVLISSVDTKKTILSLKVQQRYKNTAEEVANEWAKLGLRTKIEVVDTIPANFQAYLGDFNIPRDPDQYTLWHSSHPTNITKYKNLRIDKLLEDGRTVSDVTERVRIYNDFQKYLLDDSPASFLYFPYTYVVEKT